MTTGLGGELSLIEFLRELLAEGGEGVRLGVGDDAAILEPPARPLLVSADALVEDVHFRWAWSEPFELGRKTAAVNLSDIAAMGGRPRWATLTLSLPADEDRARFEAFARGVVAHLGEYGAALVGGDLTGSPGPWSISMTLIGESPAGGALRRAGARPGDDLWVLGALGDAALALAALERGEAPARDAEGRPCPPFAALLDPRPRCTFGQALGEAGLARAAIDVSDGLLRDLSHICRASGVSAELDMEALPRRHDDWPLVLAGGEDYALLFSAPPAARERLRALAADCGESAPPARVGRIVAPGPAPVVLRLRGSPFEAPHEGFEHLCARATQ